jgi:hypothetical protein
LELELDQLKEDEKWPDMTMNIEEPKLLQNLEKA